MINRETINDRNYNNIGFVDYNTETGDKTVVAFSGKILGFYYKKLDRTEDFNHRIIGWGDQSVSLLYIENNK